jgi:UDP-N-acetylglucosamine 2-epimerase (non-hydrolysing)
MKRIALIFGTRPEAIKLAPVALALAGAPDLACHVCVTAQHRRMLDQVLDAFALTPDADLDLMRPDQALADLTARAVAGVDAYLRDHRPDLVLVQGDTTTVFCAALAAFYRGVPVGHVEAGLRTGDLAAPFPEEANRVLTSRLADLHFAPTASARDNLLREDVPAERIHVTGNTVIDALRLALARVREDPPAVPGLAADVLDGGAPLVLITGHRRENFGPGFEAVCRALARLADAFPDHALVYPVHLNPNVQDPVRRLLGGRGNVHLIDPVPYLPFVRLLDASRLIVTDSGGVQEEAPGLGKPVLVTREKTERPEAVAAGTVKLVGTDGDRLFAEASRLLQDEGARAEMARAVNPYGDGKAAGRIVEICRRRLA